MSDTNAKQRDGSPDTVEANATQVDDDDVDLDLDAALFGDDDEDNAEPSADGMSVLATLGWQAARVSVSPAVGCSTSCAKMSRPSPLGRAGRGNLCRAAG